MANTVIKLKKSATSGATPVYLEDGEIAINYADGRLFYKDDLGSIKEISGGVNTFATINVAGVLLTPDIKSDILTINQGQNIEITPDILTDTFSIAANLKPVFDLANAAFDRANLSNDVLYVASAYNTANAAYDKANAGGATVSNTAPSSPTAGRLWWDTTTGRMYIYYTDTDSSQWVEATPSGSVIDYNLINNAYTVANASYTQSNNHSYFAGNNGDKGNATGLGDIFRVHSNTLSQNVTIYSGNNALCAGPITISGTSTTLTIQTGARVTIV